MSTQVPYSGFSDYRLESIAAFAHLRDFARRGDDVSALVAAEAVCTDPEYTQIPGAPDVASLVRQAFDAAIVVNDAAAKMGRAGYTFAQACEAPLKSRYYIKNITEPNSVGVWFGDSGTLKSFIGTDMLAHVGTGKSWCGKRVHQTGVLVVLGEGQGGYAKRLRAWATAHKVSPADVKLYVLPRPVDLGAGSVDLAAAIDEAEAALGVEVGLILIDTYSTNMGNADEQSNGDATRVLGNARAAANGRALVFVHHVGHGDKKRERGAYGLRGNVDFRFLIERDDAGDVITMTNLKVKDGKDGEVLRFAFREVELGTDDDGDPITSLVINPTERTPSSKPVRTAPTAKNQKVTYAVIGELLCRSTTTGQAGAPASRPCIRAEVVAEACKGRLQVETKRLNERVASAINGLVADGFLTMKEGWLWIP